MSCFNTVLINGKEVVSELQPQILEILKNNPHIVSEQYEEFDSIDDLQEDDYIKAASDSYNYFDTLEFKEDFGDWRNLDPSIDVERKHPNGEPKLIQDKNNKKYYYKDKHGDKVYFPLEQNGLNYIFSSEEIQEGTRVLAYQLFKQNFNDDWNDLSFENKGDLKELIRDFINERTTALADIDEYLSDRIQDSLVYIDEWADNVQKYFENLGFKIEQSDVEEQDGEVDNSRSYGVAAWEVSPSNSVSTNIWTFLSFLPNNDVDTVFVSSSFEDTSDVYQTLQTELSNLSPTIIGGQVEDLYETMLTKIGTLAHKKPYFKELLNILNNPSLSEDKKSQFTQAFNLVKNPFFVSEVDFSGKNIRHTAKDVSQVNANFNSIKREWGFNFETIFIEDGKLNTAKLTEINDDIKVIRSEFDKFKKLTKDGKKGDQKVILSDLSQHINTIIRSLHDMGAVTTEQGFNSYIGNLEDVLFSNEELVDKTNKVLSIVELFSGGLLSTNPKTNIKVFNENGKFINPFNTQSLFSDLAKEEAFYKPDGSDASIYSANKSYWIYSLPSYLAGEINKWKSNIEELESLYREPGNESSKWLEYILGYDQNRRPDDRLKIAKQRIKEVKLGIFNVFQEKKTDKNKSDPKNNGELAKDDAVLDSMNRILMSVKGENSLFNTPTPADKLTSYLLSHGYFLNTNVNEIVDKRAVLPSKVIQVFYDYFNSEYNRMIRATKDLDDPNAKKYVHYHANKKGFKYAEKDKDGKLFNFNNDKVGQVIGNAFKSQIFEGLSFENIKDVLPEIADRIYQDDGTPALDSINSYETEIKEYIHNILKDGIAEKVSFLTSKDIISPNLKTKGGYDSRGIDASIMKAYEAYNYPVLNAVSDYYINGLISNIEYGKMFSGDSAYYKDMVDYAKRIPATYTDGLQLRLQNGDSLTYNVAIVTGVEVAGKNVKDIEEIAGKTIAKMYSKGKVNTTDAQAWITPKRWEFLVKRLGLWTKYHESALPKMLGTDKTAFTEKEAKAVAQPLKGVYYKRNNGVPTFLKYSQAVLLPDLIKGTDLQRVYDKMIENGIDETITLDGIKVGATTTDLIHNEDGTLADEFDLTPLKLDNRGWKLQQNLPIKGYKETDTGSQIQKNVLTGIANNMEKMFFRNNLDIKGVDLYKDINAIVGELSQRGIQNLSNELSIDESGVIGNKSALYNLLLDEAKKRNINENLIKALEKELTIYGIPQSQSKLMNMFMSIVKDRLVKIKTNGGSFIQVSNFGIDTLTEGQETGVKWFIDPKTGLRPPHFAKDENGEYILNEAGNKIVKPGQVLLPGSLLTKYIPDWKDMDAADLKAMISPEILENIIGYRIPNQGLSSNDALEIVGFLPEGMGDAVVAYSEIPTKTGSDFDIDKMFMMVPSFSQDENDNLVYAKPKLDEEGNELPLSEQPKEVLQNKLIESYKAVFLHPDVVKDVMTPIDFDYVKKDINSIFDDSGQKSDLYHFDVINQINIKYDFLAGKAGVGQTANMLVDHVRGMFTKNSLRDTYIGWGHKNENNETLFDEEYSVELNNEDAKYISEKVGIPLKEVKKYKISNSISAFLNAFVDIAKDPYVTRGNWTTQTSNTGFMMLRAGMHPMYVNRFIGQPIIKKYVDFVINIESKFNKDDGDQRDKFLRQLAYDKLEGQTLTIGTKTLDYNQINRIYKGKKLDKINLIKGFKDYNANVDQKKLDKALSEIRDARDIIYNLQTNDYNVRDLTLKQLDDQIKNPNSELQLEILNEFYSLQDHSKTVVRGIKAAKPDTEGAGKDLSSRLMAQNVIEEIKSDERNKVKGSLTNFSDKLVDPTTKESTILGHYVNNSVYWLDKVTKANPKLFQMANEHVENTINVISQQLRGTKLLNEKIADQLYKDYYTYSLSGFDGLKLKSSAKLLFIDLASELTNEKLENEDNYFLNQLEVIQEDGLNFIKLQNKKRSEGIQNKLYRGWKDLFEENPDLATKLVKYSYYQSGFNSNINEFFSHIPHEYFVETKLNRYIYDLDMRTNGLQTKFIDQMYRHNFNNTLIVPNLPKKQVSVLKQDMSYIFDNKNMTELKLFAKVGDNLVKLEGYDANGNGIYVNTFKLGIEKDNGKIIEYKFDIDVTQSQLPANNPKNLAEINEYVKTLQIAKLPGEFKSKTKSVDNTLTKAEVEFNEMFEETTSDAKTQYQELVDEYSDNDDLPSTSKSDGEYTFKHNNISIDTSFKLGEEQATALRNSIDYIENPGNNKFFTIEGSAGTGKTTIIGYLQKYFDKKGGRNEFRYLAPTHAATAQLALTTVDLGNAIMPSTLASSFYSFKNAEGKLVKGFQTKLKVDGFANYTLIVDEASMIEDGLIVDFTETAKENGINVIFMGDSNQIPSPDNKSINDKGQKVLNRAFGDKNSTSLTKVYRQNKSDLLSTLDVIKANTEISTEIIQDNNDGTIQNLTTVPYNKELMDDFSNNLENTIYVAYTNAAVKGFNRKMKKALTGSDKLLVGDKIMGYAGNDTKQLSAGNIANSIPYMVDNYIVVKNTSKVSIEAKSKLLDGLINKGVEGLKKVSESTYVQLNFTDSIIIESITKEDMEATNKMISEDINKLYEEYINIPNGSFAKKTMKDKINFHFGKYDFGDDYYFNPKTKLLQLQPALRGADSILFSTKKGLDYGYSITAHKSQGMTVDNVYVDFDNIYNSRADRFIVNKKGDVVNREKNALYYVALSRARNKVIMKSNNVTTISKPVVNNTKPVKIDMNQLNLFSDDVNSKLDEFDDGCKQ